MCIALWDMGCVLCVLEVCLYPIYLCVGCGCGGDVEVAVALQAVHTIAVHARHLHQTHTPDTDREGRLDLSKRFKDKDAQRTYISLDTPIISILLLYSYIPSLPVLISLLICIHTRHVIVSPRRAWK